MLLRELADQARVRGALQTEGYQNREVKWEIVLTSDSGAGSLRSLGDGKRGETLLVPDGVRPGSAPKPFIVADKAGMVLGVPKKSANDLEATVAARKAAICKAAYLGMLEACMAETGDPGVASVRAWFAAGSPGLIATDVERLAETHRIVFRLEGHQARVHESDAVKGFWAAHTHASKSNTAGHCIVCGLEGPLADTFPQQIRAGALGADQASLISVNERAFGRQARTQLAAAPVCLTCAQASVVGLQSLLDTQYDKSGGRQAIRLADDRRLVFWFNGDTDGSWLLDSLSADSPAEVARVLQGPDHGPAGQSLDFGSFTAATFSLNKSRVVVSSWDHAQLPEVQSHVGAWFRDLQLQPAFPRESTRTGVQGFHTLWQIEAALNNPAASTVRPGTGLFLWTAALFGRALPRTLLSAAVARERIESRQMFSTDRSQAQLARRRSAARCGLIHLYLIRHATTGASMTTAETLGRIFATLESLQAAALGRDLNAPLAAKWLSRASTNPRAAYPAMLRDANPHVNKLRKNNPGAAYRIQGDLDTLVAQLSDTCFPAVLSLEEQGAWFIGLHRARAENAAAIAAAVLAKGVVADADLTTDT